MTLLQRESIELEIEFGEDVAVEMAQGLVARLSISTGKAGQQVTIVARDFLGAGRRSAAGAAWTATG